MMNKSDIEKIFTIFAQTNPNPRTELNYINDYTLLIAIVLSAQATDISVNKATEQLFLKINNPYEMLKLGEENLKEYIKTIGLYNSKAKNIIALSKILIEKFSGIVPRKFDELFSFPGVGRKTANVFLNCIQDEPVIAVDTHVFRVSNRIGLVKAQNVLDAELQLIKIIPKKWLIKAHHWLILHGRYVCKAKKPDCPNCLIKNLCQYQHKKIT